MTSENSFDNFPSGTITFLFTDIEDSTQLLISLGDAYAEVLKDHRTILRQAFADHNGVEVDTQGDSFFVAFSRASDGVSAAVQAQRDLLQHDWGLGKNLRVRMALHTGEANLTGDGYVGIDVHRAARIAGASHGGQILLSKTTRDLIETSLPADLELLGLGDHRFKDLDRPQTIYQVTGAELQVDFPPINSLDAFPNNLPIQPTPLLGRRNMLAEVHELLSADDVRLVTLTGPGGTGKTRLGLQEAAEAMEDFPDGVYFVSLAPVRDPDLVLTTIAHTLGVVERGSLPIQNILTEQLQSKRMLLLLDNFEQVVPAAPAIGELIQNCPELKVIVTSREPLRLRAEYEYAVGGLDLPDLGQQLAEVEISGNSAIDLFVQRAKAANPKFELSDTNLSAVAEICVRLAGLPLAIELAAARVKILSPDAIIDRMEQVNGKSSLKLLSRGARDAPDRHRTLRSTIRWSYDLLDFDERSLFRRLSIFVGGFSLEAAELICAGMQPLLNLELFDGVASLLEKSLLIKAETADLSPRFSMLELIREFGREELLEMGEFENLASVHASYYLDLAIESAPHLEQADQADWLEILEIERGNLRAAMWQIRYEKQTEMGLQLCAALHLYWYMRGYLTEGRDYCDSILRLPNVDDHPTLQATVLDKAGHIAAGHGGQGDYESAIGYIERSLAIRREIGDQQGIGDALANLAFVLYNQNSFEPAKAMYTEALEIHNKLNNEQGQADALSNLGFIDYFEGRSKNGETKARQCAQIWENLGDHHGVAWAYNILGLNQLISKNSEKSIGSFNQALNLAIDNDISWMIAFSLECIALFSATKNSNEQALVLGSVAQNLRQAAGESRSGIFLERFDHSMSQVRSKLVESQAEVAWDHGSEMEKEMILDYLKVNNLFMAV